MKSPARASCRGLGARWGRFFGSGEYHDSSNDLITKASQGMVPAEHGRIVRNDSGAGKPQLRGHAPAWPKPFSSRARRRKPPRKWTKTSLATGDEGVGSKPPGIVGTRRLYRGFQ